MGDRLIQGVVLAHPASDEQRQVLTLVSEDLLSKWGFNDGDLPDWIWDVCDEQRIDHDAFEWHDVLWALANEHLSPALGQHVHLVRIETNHNPVRASTVDGVDVEEQWMKDPITRLTPESVTIPVDSVLETIRKVAAEAD